MPKLEAKKVRKGNPSKQGLKRFQFSNLQKEKRTFVRKGNPSKQGLKHS